MRQRYPSLAAALVLVLFLAACGGDTTSDQASPTPTREERREPTLRLVSPAEGEAIRGNVVPLDVEVENFRVVKADGDTSGETGHFHVFVDREPVPAGTAIPMEPGIIHSTEDPIMVTGLPVGEHTLRVVLGDGTHKRIGTAQADLKVNVQGPSVTAKAPAQLTEGQEGLLEISVQGVNLVPADQDPGQPPGQTGHLHILINPESAPKADGTPIPPAEPNKIIHTTETVYKLKGLGPGQHTLWIVLGDKGHVPFNPLVADRVNISITGTATPAPGPSPAGTEASPAPAASPG